MTPNHFTVPITPTGQKILIVDDEPFYRQFLADILSQHGYVLAEAISGADAVEAYSHFQPDLVLLDTVMPGMDGAQICRRLKHTHGDECAPIIFITATNEAAGIVEGLPPGGVDYLRKPFLPGEILARVQTHLHDCRLAREQKALVQQLRQIDAAKDRLLTLVAHDLRNPVDSIRGLAEFLRDGTSGPLNVDQLELVNTIHSASQSMFTLVGELMAAAAVRADDLQLYPARQSLAELIEQSIAFASVEATRKKMHIALVAPTPAPAATIDVVKIRQVADSLLSNAVKYSPPGSTIIVEVQADAEACWFGVKDQGPGIPEHERDRLFQDFGRLSVKTTGGEKGTGLGLANSRKIVEAHRGTIVAENLPGGGCEFRVTLPLALDAGHGI
jgi:two-component system, sensor histidine kinase and response regulator